MAVAKLTKIGIRNLKSFGPEYQEIDVAPLTVLVGRNNSGKSTIVQSVLLLKQTLAHPRPEVQLHLEGFVDVLGLQELTHRPASGHPAEGGPEISVQWESRVDVERALDTGARPLARAKLAEQAEIPWIAKQSGEIGLTTWFTVKYEKQESRIRAYEVELSSERTHSRRMRSNPGVIIRWNERREDYEFLYNGRVEQEKGISVKLQHFLPYVEISRSAAATTKAQLRAFRLLYEQPLEHLKSLLSRLRYLGSTRTIPPTLYRPLSSPPDDVGVSGDYAAQLLHARGAELIHFLPLMTLDKHGKVATFPDGVRALTLQQAVNDTFRELGIAAKFRLEDIKDVGFRLLFGDFSLQHVGRGISYLLPVVETGLIADPLRGQPDAGEMPLGEYLARCELFSLLALEEPESHIHPKVQSRFAHLLVSLARSGRQILVETHSDHLVRRLRGLIAGAASGSEAEAWLRESVNIVQVHQDDQGVTRVKQSRLTPEGAIADDWPADFMDVAPDEERAIYHAGMDKREATEQIPYSAGMEIVDEEDQEGS